MLYEFQKGPAIQVDFFLTSESLRSINLSLTDKTALCVKMHDATSLQQKALFDWIERYLEGVHAESPLPFFDHLLTPFTLSVLEGIQCIAFSQTMTYQDLAKRLGKPKAARPVGSACGRNPWPLIIPCHRVVGKSGIGGFSLDLEVKMRILRFEMSTCFGGPTS